MSFVRHLLPTWRRELGKTGNTNAAILSAIDEGLREAEKDTIEGKVVMNLESSHGKWLDQYGDIFGVIRRDKEEDEEFRKRIIDYVLLKRGTIPAIIEAVKVFLQDDGTHVDIYEPYNDIFYLNRSKLNGKDHFLGEYYTFAIIDIRIDKPTPAKIDLTNIMRDFKPAGVSYRLSFRPNTYVGEVVNLPLSDSETYRTNTNAEIMNAMNDKVRGHLSLSGKVRDGDDGSGLFTLNRSRLNSLDRLAGSFSASNSSYNLATISNQDLEFTTDTLISEVQDLTTRLSDDFYIRTGKNDELYASVGINTSQVSYIYITLDVFTYFDINFNKYLREVTPSGVYTKSTYLSLMGNPYLQYKLASMLPSTGSSRLELQIRDVTYGKWDPIYVGDTYREVDSGIVTLNNLENYLSDTGLIFTRIMLNPDTVPKDIDMFEFQLYFFELGFKKEIAVRPTVQMYRGDVGTNTTINPI